MEAHIVYRNDELDYQLGTEPIFKHRPTLEKRGEMIAVYAEAHIRGGYVQREILTKDDIQEIKKRSQATTGPWFDFEGEMWRKSAIKRLFKYLPKTEMSDELIAALSIEHRNETTLVTVDDITPEVAAEIFQDVEAEVLEAEEKPKAKRGRPAKVVLKEEPIVEAKEEPIVEAKKEPAVEVKEEPIVEVPKPTFKETTGQELLKVEYTGPQPTTNPDPKAKVNGSSLTDLMQKLT
jgi:recombination protein RecT